MNHYKTIISSSKGLYKEKGSKFIGISFPCNSILTFKIQLEVIKKQYHDARHHCFAYRLKPDGSLYRYNDDGEPKNSAGKPILGQIDHFKLTNTGIIVVRYFGGTKLGVGGLIKAYREAAKNAINQRKVIKKEITSNLIISFPYTEINPIMSMIKVFDLKITHQKMELNCEMTLEYPVSKKTEITYYLNKYTKVEKEFYA